MTASRGWRTYLRLKCFLIAYLHLIACVVDIACHIAVVSIATHGFQCDVTEESLKNVNWPWFEPFLLFVNLGTHGFYPFPLVLRSRPNVFVDHTPLNHHPRCYPGMMHVSLIDVLNLMINLIWLKIVKDFVIAVHKKNPEPMRMFFAISLLKLILQTLYFSFQPELSSMRGTEGLLFVRILDIMMVAIFLYIIHKYIKQVREENRLANVDQPPPYIECLIASARLKAAKPVEKQTAVAIPEETKKVESVSEPEKV